MAVFAGCTLQKAVASDTPLRLDRAQMITYTSEWTGERFDDGRPKVPDGILERMKIVTINQAWQVCRTAGYEYQFERGWQRVQPNGGPLVGRALTATYMPKRPDIFKATNESAKAAGRVGSQITWPIKMLVPGDVYVADVYGKEVGGPIVGASLATAIVVNSGNGVVFDGEIRDLTEIERNKGFNGFVRNFNPTSYSASMLVGINIPTRIGAVTVMPGDIVLGAREGIMFIPSHLAEQVVTQAESEKLRDMFGFERLKEKKYTLEQVYGKWPDEVESDYSNWLKENIDRLPVAKAQVEEILRKRSK